MNLTRREFALATTTFALTACAADPKAESADDVPATTAKPPSLGKALAPFFPFGSAITPGQVLLGASDFIKEQFTVVVAENAMKPEELAKKAEGQYSFEQADDLVDFARVSGIKVRGHTLVWHQQVPAWYFVENGKEVSRATLIARMERYIADVVGHFKGRVFAWDVVNEAFSFGEPNVKTDDNGMRMSRFRQIIGEDYIDDVTRITRDANETASMLTDYLKLDKTQEREQRLEHRLGAAGY